MTSSPPVQKSPLKIVVGNDPGARSGPWRVFSQGDEVYVGPRRLATKASLHSGRAGFRQDKPFIKWPTPPELSEGVRVIYRLWFPTDELEVPPPEPADKAGVVLVSPAPPGGVTLISVVRTSAEAGLQSDLETPSALLGVWTLRGTDRVWTIAHHVPVPEGSSGVIEAAREQARDRLRGLPEGTELGTQHRLLLFEEGPDGVRGIVEVRAPDALDL